jgi:hypothetical protein
MRGHNKYTFKLNMQKMACLEKFCQDKLNGREHINIIIQQPCYLNNCNYFSLLIDMKCLKYP